VFDGPDGPVRLSELFEAGKDTLLLYNFMFIPGEAGLPLEKACPSCTSIIDAVDGEAPHIVVSAAALASIIALAAAAEDLSRLGTCSPSVSPLRSSPPRSST
jgi:predicted dithiol-disulfide oxidoreductase (DUF899 family)